MTVGVVGYLTRDIVFRTAQEAIDVDLTEGVNTFTLGGTAANVAAWLASINEPCELLGMVGEDAVGTALIGELRARGVNLNLVRGGKTPVIVSVVTGSGDRRLLVDNGGPFGNMPFPDPRMELDWIHIPGHVLMRSDLFGQCLTLLHQQSRTVRISVDVCSNTRLRSFGVNSFLDVLAMLRIDALLMNELEASAFKEVKEIEKAAPVAVIHNGSHPSRLWDLGVWSEVEEGIDCALLAVDTTGAGDAFAAGFIAEYLRVGVAKEAVIRGHAMAQAAITGIGGLPDEEPGAPAADLR